MPATNAVGDCELRLPDPILSIPLGRGGKRSSCGVVSRVDLTGVPNAVSERAASMREKVGGRMR
jgi:hypothetical protein